MTATKKLTLKDHIRFAFLTSQNRWMLTGEIHAYTINTNLQSIYSTVSAMYKNHEINRRDAQGGGYEYQLGEEEYEELKAKHITALKTSPVEEQAAAEQTSEQPQQELPLQPEAQAEPAAQPETPEQPQEESTGGESAGPEVQQIPEGVSGRKRSAHWNDEDKEKFCKRYLEVRELNPGLPFISLAYQAQKVLTEDKQKATIHNKQQFPWLEDCLHRIAQERAEEKRIEEMHRREREAQEAQEAAQAERERSNLLHNLPQEALFGEIIRRGSSLIEAMLINALSSPAVREAMISALHTDRRHNTRHDAQPAQPARDRFPKIVVVGLNKPIHQNEVSRQFKDVFDMRYCPVKTPSAQILSMARGADHVIVMDEHVKHAETQTLKNDNIKFERVSGSVGKLKEHLAILMAK